MTSSGKDVIFSQPDFNSCDLLIHSANKKFGNCVANA